MELQCPIWRFSKIFSLKKWMEKIKEKNQVIIMISKSSHLMVIFFCQNENNKIFMEKYIKYFPMYFLIILDDFLIKIAFNKNSSLKSIIDDGKVPQLCCCIQFKSSNFINIFYNNDKYFKNNWVEKFNNFWINVGVPNKDKVFFIRQNFNRTLKSFCPWKEKFLKIFSFLNSWFWHLLKNTRNSKVKSL